MALDESISDGQAGHLTDHDVLHVLANNRLVVYIQHGGTAGTARPTVAGSAAAVGWWDGSVEPTNAVNGDVWTDTANDVVKQKQSGTFVSLGVSDHGNLSGLADFTADHGSGHDAHDHSTAVGTATAADLPNVAAGGIAATDVQAALNELDTEKHGDGGTHSGAQPVTVEKAGVVVGTRPRINLIEGANVTLTVADDATDDEVDVTVAASGGSGSSLGSFDRVTTLESTSSTSWTDLATAGPSVDVEVPASGEIEVVVAAWMRNDTAGAKNSMAFALSGANTKTPQNTDRIQHTASGGNGDDHQSAQVARVTGLSAGTTTVTAKYEVNSGTGRFENRLIIARPVP